MEPNVVDLNHCGIAGAIGVYVLDGPEPTLIDPGPTSTLVTLEAGLRDLGMEFLDVRRVFLTHIHLDHAGATGALLASNPAIRVYVHEDGAPHLVDPSRLVKSTARTFGPRSDDLWGETSPVPAGQIDVWRAGEKGSPTGFRALHSPGHIASHLAYQSEDDGTLFSGDVMGIILHPGAPSHPPTPPPTADLASWYETLEGWADLDVPRFGPTHFGIHENFQSRRIALLETLRELESRGVQSLSRGDTEEEGARYSEEVLSRIEANAPDPSRIREYFTTFGADTDWRGLIFHLERRDR